MDIVYYPDMFITNEETLKALVLFWGNVRTIVPPSQMNYIKAYLSGQLKNTSDMILDKYKEIKGLSGTNIVDFLEINENERKSASEKMFTLISDWNRHTRFYNSLKIKKLNDLTGKVIEWYWFLHEKLEHELVELLLEEQLACNWAPGEIIARQEVGKSYMSIIADEIKNSRNISLITEDEFYIAAKSGINLNRVFPKNKIEEGYQLVSLAIPQVFLTPGILKPLSWKKVIKIRQELLPFAENYFGEVKSYQEAINSLQLMGKDEDAFEKFCEFCERLSISFRPFAKETGKILRLAINSESIGYINGIALPTIKLLQPEGELAKFCDIASISLMLNNYILRKNKISTGFEYLENLNRRIRIENFKGFITCLIPKKLRKSIGSRIK